MMGGMAAHQLHVTCTHDGCSAPHYAKGLCRAHYTKAKRGTLHRPVAEYTDEMSVCAADDCSNEFPQRRRGARKEYCSRQCRDRQAKRQMRAGGWIPPHLRAGAKECSVNGCSKGAYVHGLCSMHWERMKKTGDVGPVGSYHSPGEWKIDSNGYRRRSLNGESQLEHRVVMEQILGRPLIAGENVHHVNGDRADNRPENLELWTTSQPAGQRVADKVAWAREILALYGEDY